MSKKYIESMNKITVDDKLKKRILQKVSEAKEEDNNINTVIPINRSKYNKMWTKSVGLVAACCAFVVCTSLNGRFPELFNKGNVNSNNENVENDNLEIDNSTISDESNKAEISLNSGSTSVNSEESGTDNTNETSKEDNNYINNTGKETRSNGTKNKNYQENVDNSNGGSRAGNRSETDLNNAEGNSGNIQSAVLEGNNYNSENTEAPVLENNDYKSASINEEKNDSADTVKKSREMPGNMQEEFEIPEALKNDAEITYTLLVSDATMEVGYKGEGDGIGDGILRISSHEMDESEINDYPNVETIKTSNCEAVIMSNEEKTKKYAEWKLNNKFYSLNTDGDSSDEEIITIIESCR
ncbi:MAG: hypothetical protein Q4F66_02230 [Clostridium sp.]|nr:hypothetical protein [Clostridium sp.]